MELLSEKQLLVQQRKKSYITFISSTIILIVLLVGLMCLIWLTNTNLIFSIVISVCLCIVYLYLFYNLIAMFIFYHFLYKNELNNDYNLLIKLCDKFVKVPLLIFHNYFLTFKAHYYFLLDDLESFKTIYLTLNCKSQSSLAFEHILYLLEQEAYEDAKKEYLIFSKILQKYKNYNVNIILESLRLLFLKIEFNKDNKDLKQLVDYIHIPTLYRLYQKQYDGIGCIEVKLNQDNEKPVLKKYIGISILFDVLSIASIFLTLITMFVIYYFNQNDYPLQGSWVGFIYALLPLACLLFGVIKKLHDRRYKVVHCIVIGIVCLFIVLVLSMTGFSNPNTTSTLTMMI